MSLDIIEQIEAEEHSLELHTKLCAQRYLAMTKKFTDIDRRLDNIESTLLDIKESINSSTVDTFKRYLSWAGVIIIVLTGAFGTLAFHLLKQ